MVNIYKGFHASQASLTASHRSTPSTGRPRLIALHCSSQILWFLQVATWQPCTEQLSRCIFPTAFAHFVSLCHVLVILCLYYLLRWSVIGDLLRFLLSLCQGHHRPHAQETENLVSLACVPTAPLTALSPSSLPLLRAPCSPRHSLKLGQF